MPSGWKGVEKQYGPTSKCAGQTYIRWYSLDGRHKHVCTIKEVIKLDCKSKGLDPDEHIRAFEEKRKQEAEERKAEREQMGHLKGAAREDAINRFEQTFGKLSGPVVFSFPGWTTRWHYQPNCDQVMVEYVDTEGNSWKLLRDLECYLQKQADMGNFEKVTKLLEAGSARGDLQERFPEGSRTARECGGVFEITPDQGGEGTVRTQEERALIREEKEAQRKDKSPSMKRKLSCVYLDPDGPKQTGWAALQTQDDMQKAFSQFRELMVERGFKNDVELLAVHGVETERYLRQRICGIYFSLPENFGEQHCYMKLLHFPRTSGQTVGCDGIYISWSALNSRWEISAKLTETKPVIAYSARCSTSAVLSEAAGPWQVQDGQGNFMESAGLSVLVAKA
mmetsp:Transcript_36859/g.70882  ORF Transcript_36859/g.70882 Transcript_36859/m.70882 type:complete len:394 (+) Transcript_36859:1-1182(+)